mmetsp:Transcript_17225/g.25762  ORF Transcript_17225/g.25762 Transcript_17225/m.25762 type:complete len:214 (+) Transcript_17225:170-811(+)
MDKSIPVQTSSTNTQVASPIQVGTANPPSHAYYVEASPANPATGYTATGTFSQNASANLVRPSNPGPPQGRWKDDICNWASNLWPSCGCLCVVFGGWLVAQIAHKTGYLRFDTIIMPYIIIYIIISILAIFFGNIVYLVPFFIVFFLAMALRFHVVKKYNIAQYGCFLEFLIAFFCCPCSISQMARHVYGYREVLDGDSKADARDYYDGPMEV